MSYPRGVIKYRCECGAEYLIALDTTDPSWLETVREAAEELGLEVVDGSESSFTCVVCGRLHARQEAVSSSSPS